MSTNDIGIIESPARDVPHWARAVLAPTVGFGIYAAATTLNLAQDAGQPAEQGLGDWALAFAIALAGVAVATMAGARALRGGTEARTGLIVGIVAVLGIVVFWTGIPCVFGATAVALGARGLRTANGSNGVAIAATLLGGLALVAGAVTMFSG